jgi:hypothetical protein
MRGHKFVINGNLLFAIHHLITIINNNIKMCNTWLMRDIRELERQNFSAHQLREVEKR